MPLPRRSKATSDLIARRLRNQRLMASTFHDPAQIVGWLGAVQAQEYAVAKWALGLRGSGLTDAGVERACDEGQILRTHVMRPTWHLVSPADIRWMQALTAPRVAACMASYNRKLDLTSRVFARSHGILARALEGNRYLTRTELAAALARRGVHAHGQRLGHLMMQAEIDQVICSGPRRAKQFTYALLAERAPRARTLPREAALAELTRRYFSSHGPATVKDYAWWSGLTMKDARLGVELCRPGLTREEIDDLTYWSSPADAGTAGRGPATYLLPIYDEYLIAYKDREHVTGRHGADAASAYAAGFPHHLIVGGRLAGSWARGTSDGSVTVTVAPFRPLSVGEVRDVKRAAARFGAFQEASIVTDVRSTRR